MLLPIYGIEDERVANPTPNGISVENATQNDRADCEAA